MSASRSGPTRSPCPCWLSQKFWQYEQRAWHPPKKIVPAPRVPLIGGSSRRWTFHEPTMISVPEWHAPSLAGDAVHRAVLRADRAAAQQLPRGVGARGQLARFVQRDVAGVYGHGCDCPNRARNVCGQLQALL